MCPVAFEEAVVHQEFDLGGPVVLEKVVVHMALDPVAEVHVAFAREEEGLAACHHGHPEVEGGHDLVDRADQEGVEGLVLLLEAFLVDLLELRGVY